MLRTVALGSSLVALVPVVRAAKPVDPDPAKPPPLMKACDLPIYDTPHADYREYQESEDTKRQMSYIRNMIQEPVRAVRQSVLSVWEQTESIQQTVRDNYNEFQDRTDWIVKYLREEENKDIRYGAVGMGGLTGFIFGLRGGFIRRLVYAGVGTTIMGAVCFPEETKELARENGVQARRYANIAYNFLYGVKPGDPQLELHFPELSVPTNFSEFVDLAGSVACSVKQMVMPPPAKEAQESPKKD